MSTIRDNIGLMVLLILVVHVAISTGTILSDPPADVFSNRDWWESVARAALAGLGTGITSAVALVAAVLGIEVRASRQQRQELD